ncbi:MAG: hypothetical protein SFU91_07110 [Chloroherpetonaceae bacterium]|nr:hypothetical protein [Chloroherpetonaceae bacterium]
MNNKPKFFVVFRACDAITSFNGSPRPFGLSKTELVKICFLSLYESLLPYEHEIVVLGDKLSKDLEDFFLKSKVTLIQGNWGNEASLQKAFDLGYSQPSADWVYFCEDDYLHSKDAFHHITDLISNKKEILYHKPRGFFQRPFSTDFSTLPLVIHPTDYPDRYLYFRRKKSFVFLGNTCHWRQISNTTFTFLLEKETLKRYFDTFNRSIKGANDGYLSSKLYGQSFFYGKSLCLSPIPGIASHMHIDTISPLVKWKKRIDEIEKVQLLGNLSIEKS